MFVLSNNTWVLEKGGVLVHKLWGNCKNEELDRNKFFKFPTG